MKYYSFDDYWKNVGKFNPEIDYSNIGLEQKYYNLCKRVWNDSLLNSQKNYNVGYKDGLDDKKMQNNY